jgi:hypothetical protein
MGEKNERVDLSLDDLEKSWNDSKTLLKSLLEDEGTEPAPLKKSKDEDEDDGQASLDLEGDDDEGGDDEGEDDEDMTKSLEDSIASDEDAAAAMDVEPFLRQMVKSISKKFEALEKAQSQLSTAMVKSLIAMGDQNLTIASTVQAIAEAPVGSKSVIRTNGERFAKSKDDVKDDLLKSMNVNQILEKAVSLAKSGRFTSLDVAKIQNRINKGIPLNEEYVAALTAKEDK